MFGLIQRVSSPEQSDSDDGDDLFGNSARPARQPVASDLSSEEESEEEAPAPPPPGPVDFASELAKRIGGAPPAAGKVLSETVLRLTIWREKTKHERVMNSNCGANIQNIKSSYT